MPIIYRSKSYNQRCILIFVFGLSTLFSLAQHPISSALHRLLETGNYNDANEIISKYSNKDLSNLPDSILFDFYYLKAAKCSNDGDETGKRDFLIKAKNLCEKSQGIHSPVYLEICYAIGKSYEEIGDTISVFEIYQAALIQSVGLYSLKDEDVRWQYQEIENKVKNWYKVDELRELIIKHRDKLSIRDLEKEVFQNDMEFYLRFYKDEPLKEMLSKADSLMSTYSWGEAAKQYEHIAHFVQDDTIARATLLELAAINHINYDNFPPAEDLLLNNLQILKNYKKTKTYRRTLSQLSNLYNAIHNYDKAKQFAAEAKFWFEESLDFSPGYILCLHRCATLERGSNNYFLALLLEDVAIQEFFRNKICVSNIGNTVNHGQFLANLLSSCALHYNQVGFRKEAYLNIEKAIDLAETHHFDASTYYCNMADIFIADRDFSNAAAASEKAYRLSDSENNKITIGTTLCLSQFLAHQSISNDILVECSQNLQSLIKKTFSFTSNDERARFWKYFEYYFPLLNFLSYQTSNNEAYKQIYNNVLVEKGLLLRTANKIRDMIYNEGSQDDIQMYNRMLQLRKLLPSLSDENAKSVMLEIESIDKSLTKDFSLYEDYKSSTGIKWEDVQKNLNDSDIAIEFYNIPDVKWHSDGKDLDGKYRYCAITLRKGYREPHIIPLVVDDRLQMIEQEDIYETDSIYRLIWEPLKKELNGVKNIYFAADRELHKIGIEYAPMPNGGIIGDKYNIYRLSSTRVIAENHAKGRADNAVLYGGLRYDIGKEELIAESRSGDYHPSAASRAFTADESRYGVKYLPGTLKEVEDIADNFSVKPRMITDIMGTEESFKALAGSQIDIIHLATHGFFWSDEDAKKRDYVTFLNPNNRLKQSEEDKALMRSGLFFSGANIGLKGEALPDDVEDGVLTALELSNLNLGYVDLVVMSACESGLGETSGEGVFGLQRGFKLAGANTLLMSLWKVDDTATQLLMTDFYRYYLSGKSKHESLKLAQQKLRNNQEYSDPKYWAAFIMLDEIKY